MHSVFIKFYFQAFSCKSRTENNIFGSCSNINKSTCSRCLISHPGGIYITFFVHFAGTHKGIVNSCPVIIFKLSVMWNQRLCILGNSKINSTCWNTAINTRFNCDRYIISDIFFCNDRSDNIIRDSCSDIDNYVRFQFHHCPAANHLSHI